MVGITRTATIPDMNTPEVMLPQESREEVDRLVAMIGNQSAEEQWAMKVFLQGMEFQRALNDVRSAGVGA